MNKEKRRVPKLRFPGFTEDWEQRKLESLFTKYEDKVKTPNSGYWRLGLRSHCKGTFHTYVDAGNELETAEMNRVQSGNFILNITFAWERALAVTNEEDQDKLVSHRFPQFKPNRDLAIDFFKHTLMDKRFKHHLELSSPGGAGRNKVLKIADMLKYELLVPSIKEQNEISSFLNNVDYIITLHQRKLEHLNLKKKALLQKLFPKNGERHPELRFPGFTDAWEQRKLGDFYTFKNGLNKEKVYFGYGDSIVNFTDVFHNRQIYSSTLKGKVCVNKKELENYKVKEGDLFFTRTSETIDEIGFPAVVMEPMERVVFSGFVLRGRAEKNDPLVNIFKSYIFFTDNFRSEMKKKSSMTTRALTSGTALKEMYFSYPKDLEEQTKIGEILLRLDNIITLHQRKLEHLQLQKKALLQQMFV